MAIVSEAREKAKAIPQNLAGRKGHQKYQNMDPGLKTVLDAPNALPEEDLDWLESKVNEQYGRFFFKRSTVDCLFEKTDELGLSPIAVGAFHYFLGKIVTLFFAEN